MNSSRIDLVWLVWDQSRSTKMPKRMLSPNAPAQSDFLASIDLVVSDKKIFKISANENTLWTLAAMLDFISAPKTQIW
jgi:hypothetical protein